MRQCNHNQIKIAQDLLEELKEHRGGSLSGFHKKIANDPQLLDAFLKQYAICIKGENVIPIKYRELIMLALGCARGCKTTINSHGKLAYINGATIGEIGEVLRLVFMLCGGPALILGAQLFEEIDD